jgi:putative ABC transport system permease protein
MNRKAMANLKIAMRALRVNKMRSALTTLGIVIGVAAVIVMLAIGTGAQRRIRDQIASIGSNMLMVMPGSLSSGGMRMGMGGAVTLTEEDARAIARECPAVEAASPVVRGGAQVVYSNNNWSTSIQGVTPDFLTIRNLRVTPGRPFTEGEVETAAKVALLGKTVADKLFGTIDPVGQVVRIKQAPFTVVGVLESKGQSMMGQDQDDLILLPITSAKKRVIGLNQANARAVNQIMITAWHESLMTQAQGQVEALLRQRHRIQAGDEDDFTVRNMQEMAAASESAVGIMKLLLAGIASVSLLVGGIGIMNTMLISVTERTREIGLRQAVGAKPGDIRLQFLVESVTLSALGGALGIAIGVSASLAFSKAVGWDAMVGPGAISLAFVFSAFVGIFFGYYPARKAALMDPIEALRYE